MRIPVSVLRTFQVGLSGTTLALAVGCSQPAAANKDPAPSATTETTTQDEAKPANATRASESRSPQQSPTVRDDRQVPDGSWFLSQPGAPQTNQPTQPVSEQQQPVVVQVQPKPKPIVHQPNPANPNPTKGHWNVSAACGRG